MNLTHITITGASVGTPLSELKALSAKYPLAEWGLLYSASRAGGEPRYPKLEWLFHAADSLRAGGCRIALHLCGSAAVSDFIQEPGSDTARLANLFDRVQLNLPESLITQTVAIDAAIRRHPAPVITQQNARNTDLNQTLLASNHQILFDASGGRGTQASEWPSYWSQKAGCGYAGGLSPDNVETELPLIAASAADRPFWIDCENRVRDQDDQLSLPLSREMLQRATAVAYRSVYSAV